VYNKHTKELKMVEWHDTVDWELYEARVVAYEAEGMTRSDAQAVVDAELMNE
jgi:hypothetical protein